jgi:hypothetical protein
MMTKHQEALSKHFAELIKHSDNFSIGGRERDGD